MNINFPPVDEQYIKSQVELGFYGNATEMVRDAIRRLREEDERRKAFVAAVRLGEEDIAAGRVKPYTPELFETIKRNALKKFADGTEPDPDVLP